MCFTCLWLCVIIVLINEEKPFVYPVLRIKLNVSWCYLRRTGRKRTVSSSENVSNVGTTTVIWNPNRKQTFSQRSEAAVAEVCLPCGSCTGSGTEGWLWFPCPSCPLAPQPNEYIFCDCVSTTVCSLKHNHILTHLSLQQSHLEVNKCTVPATGHCSDLWPPQFCNQPRPHFIPERVVSKLPVSTRTKREDCPVLRHTHTQSTVCTWPGSAAVCQH